MPESKRFSRAGETRLYALTLQGHTPKEPMMSLISVADVKPGLYGLVANVVTDHVLRHGAKVYVIATHGDARNCEVVGLSKSGRRVFKHIAWKRLTNVRAAWLTEHIGKVTQLWWNDKDAANKIAAELNELWKGVRVFHPDGTLLQDGISTGEAFKQRRSAREAKYHEIADIEPIEQRLQAIWDERGAWLCAAVPTEWDIKQASAYKAKHGQD